MVIRVKKLRETNAADNQLVISISGMAFAVRLSWLFAVKLNNKRQSKLA